MRNKLTAVKDHVIRHRFVYGVAVGTTGTVAILATIGHEWHEFLEEQGVYDAYRNAQKETSNV